MENLRKPIQQLEKPPSLHHTVQDAIKQYITDNGLAAGVQIPSENQLSQQLGVSRNLVREAVRGLEALGVLEIRRGSGLFVNHFSFEPLLDNLPYGLLFDLQELVELLEIRQALETSLIDKAIAGLSPQHIEQLQQIVAEMQTLAEQDVVFVEADRQFHQALFASVNNKTLLKVLDAFWLTFNKAAENTEVWYSDPKTTYTTHANILEAVLARDTEKARLALEQHYAAYEDRLNGISQKSTED